MSEGPDISHSDVIIVRPACVQEGNLWNVVTLPGLFVYLTVWGRCSGPGSKDEMNVASWKEGFTST